ncbi:glycoside hydrolase family 43 protein [Kineococcus sp. G2]|uniref:glycoside hydrolase family 43 protein n=1 Tax=Kineococcus sp. G2 TaxID=3127484 RepID=UPI00301CFC65
MTSTRTASSDTAPVIAGSFPDPTACRVGDDYYLAASSFEHFPGAPVFHSRDLVSWQQIGNVLTTRRQFPRGDGRPSGGVFGSTLRHHDGRFWFITTNMSTLGAGHTIVTATDPAGPWSEPVHVSGAVGLDPDLAWDRDGQCYLTYVGFGGPGGAAIVQARLDPDAGTLLEEPYPVWQGTGLAFPEGPHLYLVDDTWYLLLAEGGTERGHAVTIARGPSPAGPFEACPGNPVLTHRSTAHPVQNVGHADLVQRADGTWVAVHLGVRPRGTAPGFHVLGRETFLRPVSWEDGWPNLQGPPLDVPVRSHVVRESFTTAALHPRWVVPAGDAAEFTTATPDGLLLRAAPDEERWSSHLLCSRVTDLHWSATATVDVAPGSVARFVLRLDDRHWYAVQTDGSTVSARGRIGDFVHDVPSRPAPGGAVRLHLRSEPDPAAHRPGANSGPDRVVLGVWAPDGSLVRLASWDGRYLSGEVAAGFNGRVLGVAALRGEATLLAFEYDGNDLEGASGHVPGRE